MGLRPHARFARVELRYKVKRKIFEEYNENCAIYVVNRYNSILFICTVKQTNKQTNSFFFLVRGSLKVVGRDQVDKRWVLRK